MPNMGFEIDSNGRLVIAGASAAASVPTDTELAAAVALADALANPTSPQVLGHLMGQAPDGANDMLRTLGNVALDGLGQLCATPAVPGAGVVQSVREAITSSTTVATAATPASGNRIRIISISWQYNSATANGGETYFDTGANIGSDETKVIGEAILDLDIRGWHVMAWPDGAGPVGAVDDVVSVRCTGSVASAFVFIIHFREE